MRQTAATLASCVRLARWLGPWADAREQPDVLRERATVPGERPLEIWLYRPRRGAVRGSYLLVQGLHYAGPRDPRMDRFARVLAAGGHQVYAPAIPDFLALRVQSSAHDDVRRAFAWMLDHPDRPRDVAPGVFTISFGSLLGLGLAADRELGPRVGRLHVFGGYLDWRAAVRFAVSGEVEGRRLGSHDPLNVPVLFLHLIDELGPDAAGERAALAAAWRAFVESTWGQPELKAAHRYFPIAHRIAQGLSPATRELFLVGCGVEPGARELIEDALGRTRLDELDPTPFVPRVRCPVELLHGADDDVIPYTEQARLRAALEPYTQVRSWLTGLYGHTASDASMLTRGPAAVARELAVMAGMLGVLASGGRARPEPRLG